MKTKEEVTTNGRAVFYTVLWPSFRKAALECGWALALHGSMASDMDMMAMKWVEDAKPVEDLITALSDCIDGTIWKDNHFKPFNDKPHNRVVYTLSIYSDFHIDLSLIETEQKDLIIHGLEEGSENWKAEYDNCRAILKELVDLKIMKENLYKGNPDGKGYAERKPKAWEAAKAFLSTYQHEGW